MPEMSEPMPEPEEAEEQALASESLRGPLSREESVREAILNGSRTLAEVERDLRELCFPSSGKPQAEPTQPLELCPDYFFVNRRRIEEPERLIATVLEAMRQRPETAGRLGALLDFNLGPENPAGLAEANLIAPELPAALAGKFYHDLERGGMPEERFLSAEEKRIHIFEPFVQALGSAAYLHVDHHYPGATLSTVSTTVLMLDLVRHLRDSGQNGTLERMSRAFQLMDHSDADIMLASYVLRNATRADLFDRAEILRDTALLNDYLREPAPERNQQVKIFFDTVLSLEKRVASGRLPFAKALEAIDSALDLARTAVAAGFDERSLFEATRGGAVPEALANVSIERLLEFNRGALDYQEDREVLDGLVRTSPGQPIVPGSISKLGQLLLVYVPDSQPEVDNASSVRYLRSEHPELLEGVRVIVTSSAPSWDVSPKPRFVKIRSFIGPDARFLDLSPVFAKLREMDLGAPFQPGGRGMAGALGKFPLAGIDVPAVAKSISQVVSDEAAKQLGQE